MHKLSYLLWNKWSTTVMVQVLFISVITIRMYQWRTFLTCFNGARSRSRKPTFTIYVHIFINYFVRSSSILNRILYLDNLTLYFSSPFCDLFLIPPTLNYKMFYPLLVLKFAEFDCRILFLTLEIPWNEDSFFSQTYKKKYKKTKTNYLK